MKESNSEISKVTEITYFVGDLELLSATTLYSGEPCGKDFNFGPAFDSFDRVAKPEWSVADATPIREIIGVETFKVPDGNLKKLGGDIHSTVDVNPFSSTFGEVHSTMRIPGAKDFHK